MRKELERTGWYRGNQYPVRVGNYERQYRDGVQLVALLDYWDGGKWILLSGEGYPIGVAESRVPWRGLTRDHQ